MEDIKIARITGLCGIACVALTFGQFPLWLVGSAPSVYDGRGFAQHLFDIKNVPFARILMDQGIYVNMMVFAAGHAGPVDCTGFYNTGGGGRGIIANFPPMIWFLVVGVILVRRGDRDSQAIMRAA